MPDSGAVPSSPPRVPAAASPATLNRWRQYLADERAEAAVYRDLARHRTGEEREILLALAEAEGRHEAHWLALLGDQVGKPRRVDIRTRILGLLARRFGSVFVLALAQRAEARSPYEDDHDASPQMAADERIHEEVVRGLAARGRNRLSGTFRAAVFGANDGLVSNLSLVLGVSAGGVPNHIMLLTGLAGLLAGALSMGAGEYVSVRSQRELLERVHPGSHDRHRAAPARHRRQRAGPGLPRPRHGSGGGRRPRDRGAPRASAGAPVTRDRWPTWTSTRRSVPASARRLSSFCFFASGAVIPVLPYLFGLQGLTAVVVAAVLVGLALLATGAAVGLLSGGPPLLRGLRQLAIGYGAAAVTYLVGLLLGTSTT